MTGHRYIDPSDWDILGLPTEITATIEGNNYESLQESATKLLDHYRKNTPHMYTLDNVTVSTAETGAPGMVHRRDHTYEATLKARKIR